MDNVTDFKHHVMKMILSFLFLRNLEEVEYHSHYHIFKKTIAILKLFYHIHPCALENVQPIKDRKEQFKIFRSFIDYSHKNFLKDDNKITSSLALKN